MNIEAQRAYPASEREFDAARFPTRPGQCVPDFFASDAAAMADIEKCAAEQRAKGREEG